MARMVVSFAAGSRVTDYISLGLITKFVPRETVRAVLVQTQSASVRERDLPGHAVVYYVIALALFMRSSYREMLRRLLEGVQWLPEPPVTVRVAGKPGISQARSRLGPIRCIGSMTLWWFRLRRNRRRAKFSMPSRRLRWRHCCCYSRCTALIVFCSLPAAVKSVCAASSSRARIRRNCSATWASVSPGCFEPSPECSADFVIA